MTDRLYPLVPSGHLLPRIKDRWQFLELDQAVVIRSDGGVLAVSESGRMWIPAAQIAALLLTDGTSITAAAVRTITESGCGIVWVNHGATRVHAWAFPGDRTAKVAEQQAKLWADPPARLAVAKLMYAKRFKIDLDLLDGKTIRELRGMEGVRVRKFYRSAAKTFGIKWTTRSNAGNWDEQTPENRALSTANACVHGLAHTAIVTLGAIPSLGFIHTGKQHSFLWDIADLYKLEIAVPAAFWAAKNQPHNVERAARLRTRELMHANRLLGRMLNDILELFELKSRDDAPFTAVIERGTLWDPDGHVQSGINHGNDAAVEHMLEQVMLDDLHTEPDEDAPF